MPQFASKISNEELEERFKEYLYKHNGKFTHERMAVLRIIYEDDEHLSVDAILQIARDRDLSVSRATVYRTLDLLVQSGLAKKHQFDGHETVFEAALKEGHHDHIVCVDCNKITEFFDGDLERIQNEILSKYGLVMVKHTHQLYGRCIRPNCPEKEALKTR
ncbi:MAG: transcriptional repressor [Acidobacteria bacterium]|nr:transcriptional repressor [Acidobacteriota bacterium]